MLVVPDEGKFINQYLTELSSRAVRYGQDYTTRDLPKPLKIKRSPLTPSEPTTTDGAPSTIDLTIKILKPASQITIQGVSLDDTTIEELKERIHKQKSEVPVNRQRLLLKGKVLADNKLLSDYGLADNATLHLMLTAPPKHPETGRFGLTLTTEKKLDDPAFWDSLKASVAQLVDNNDKDTEILISKFQELTKQ
ncbi:ubiquitin-related domain-containing protein [Phascolomyces articulosus]|uniref:Ubiquitin-related domain-containing protein n=1 Tax=Phascolomyces articulosus TaxID=60185 RepID=A0AAD5JR58_9FUNG|nr:ubiquitin-related domain-containing protein [Phascolomyces articulosus]